MTRTTNDDAEANPTPVTCLFLDIGGVLLTDGWDRNARQRAASTFDLDLAEMEDRHHITFESYEIDKLTFDEYLNHVVFYRQRPFTRDQFRAFMVGQSTPYPAVIALVKRLKARYALKVAVVSNEGRELNAYRIQRFKLDEIADFFITSCFVRLRKPDADIFRLALDVSLTPAPRVAFIDNTAMFVDIAWGLGIRSIHHTEYATTRAELAALGLVDDEGDVCDVR